MADRPHLGLRLMEERTLIMGGRFFIASGLGKGVLLEIEVPLRAEERHSEISQALELS